MSILQIQQMFKILHENMMYATHFHCVSLIETESKNIINK
jgi:hypothetical protein